MSARTEREIRNEVEPMGWTVERAAGSLGPVDLMLVRSVPVRAPAHFVVRVADGREPVLVPNPHVGRFYSLAFLVEDKSVRDGKVFYPSTDARTKAQWDTSILLARRGLNMVWVVHYKLGERDGKKRVFVVRPDFQTGVYPPLRRHEGVVLGDFFRFPEVMEPSLPATPTNGSRPSSEDATAKSTLPTPDLTARPSPTTSA